MTEQHFNPLLQEMEAEPWSPRVDGAPLCVPTTGMGPAGVWGGVAWQGPEGRGR